MYELQMKLIRFKLNLERTRDRIYGDNKSGLTDPSKLFESLIAKLYNIHYETSDFRGFPSSNNPTIDLQSESTEVAVSVKARESPRSKAEVEAIVESFRERFPELAKNHSLVLQEICDKPKKSPVVNGITIRYFGDLCNLFNDNENKLGDALVQTNTREKVASQSYLTYLYEGFLVECCISIKHIYGSNTFNPLSEESLDISMLAFDRQADHGQILARELNEMWNQIKNKQYLSLDISIDAILVADVLWTIGKRQNNFYPILHGELIESLKNGWEIHKSSELSYVVGIHRYYERILKISCLIKRLLVELERGAI
jgi:hypothetical protein